MSARIPISVWLLSSTLLILSDGNVALTTPTQKPSEIHDLLPQYGFPKGLLPNNVVSYTLSPNGFFTVQLQSPCYVQFEEQLVYYHTRITGSLSYGSVAHVTGIQAQKLFLWLSVTGIKAHQDSGMLEFFVGALSQQLPANDFQDVPGCSPTGSHPTNLLDSL
ncbi:hypothetical protein VNO77_01214 [Canavalia gladiata]|uniref:Uncharacterized protein n=1 Tax=Canavalia gladiata TaxID=3824 RepID=A0AAN9MSN4_CANGL